MIYELCLCARQEVGETGAKELVDFVKKTLKPFKCEVLLEDDWGVKTLAQPTASGVAKGHYINFLITSSAEANLELNRLARINDKLLKILIVKKGPESAKEALLKAYKTPLSKKYTGSVTETEEDKANAEGAGDRRRFARRKTCWFTAKNFRADWKDPLTYNWLVNEFGKISPARVSGVSRKHQRFANTAIKQARQVGLISHLSGRTVE